MRQILSAKMQTVILVTLFVFALLYRVVGITSNAPFWVDEFSTGTSARVISEKGLGVYLNPPPGFETNNSLTYTIIALIFSIFGASEQMARIPAVLAGSLVPIAIYFLTKKLAGKTAGIAAAILVSTSYFQITWSLQARSYMMLQLFITITLLLGIRIAESVNVNKKDLAYLGLVAVLGLASHYMYVVAFGIVVAFILFQRRKDIVSSKKLQLIIGLLAVGIFTLLTVSGFLKSVWGYINSSFFLSNNLWYYHPFLWREYGIILMMAIFGLGLIIKQKKQFVGLLLAYFTVHFIFVTFFFGHHMSKYLLPIFPILFAGSGVFLTEIGNIISQRIGEVSIHKKVKFGQSFFAALITLGFVFFIVANGHKFVIKPKKYYSINHDFREIANIDYHEVYKIVKNGVNTNRNSRVALIETWPGRAYWYLGQDYEPLYVFRWQDGNELVNGHTKKTPFKVGNDGRKYITDKIGFVPDVKDLRTVMKKYSKGYIFIDDDTLPREVIDYAEKNMKKELFLDHYPLDDNPYSKWPATLYSWGMDEKK